MPNEQAAIAFRKYQGDGVIEIGAGTGYWAKYLQNREVNVTPYDICPPGPKNMNDYHGNLPAHTLVHRGTHIQALENQPHSGHTLFMCYPPPGSKMAENAIQSY